MARGARHWPRHRPDRLEARRRLSQAGLRRRSARPRIIAAEGPDMAFEVARRVVAPAIVLRLDVDHDLGPCSFRAGVMRIDVIDHHVDTLRDRPALLWRCDQTSVLRLDIA